MVDWNKLMTGTPSGSQEAAKQGSVNNTAVILAAVVAIALVAGATVFALTRKSDEDQVRETVERFYEAAGTGDGLTACSMMTEDAQILGLEGCARGVELDFESSGLGLSNSKLMRRITVENVTVNGDEAFAALSPRGEVELEKVDGDWLVSFEPLGV